MSVVASPGGDERMPVLVGCGQISQREPDPRAALSPLDSVVVIRQFAHTSHRFACPFGGSSNPPKSIAQRLDATQARQLGIPQDRWVYLHGCADAHEHWFVSERAALHHSPAMKRVFAQAQALTMAGVALPDIALFDIYSCFACAVSVAFAALAEGPAKLETYTVSHGAQGANGALVIGKLDDGGRFIANTPADTGLWDAMQREDFIGRRGRVGHDGQRNVFLPG